MANEKKKKKKPIILIDMHTSRKEKQQPSDRGIDSVNAGCTLQNGHERERENAQERAHAHAQANQRKKQGVNRLASTSVQDVRKRAEFVGDFSFGVAADENSKDDYRDKDEKEKDTDDCTGNGARIATILAAATGCLLLDGNGRWARVATHQGFGQQSKIDVSTIHVGVNGSARDRVKEIPYSAPQNCSNIARHCPLPH